MGSAHRFPQRPRDLPPDDDYPHYRPPPPYSDEDYEGPSFPRMRGPPPPPPPVPPYSRMARKPGARLPSPSNQQLLPGKRDYEDRPGYITREEIVDVYVLYPPVATTDPSLKHIVIGPPKDTQQDRILKRYSREKLTYSFPKSALGEHRRIESRREFESLRLRQSILQRYLTSLHGKDKAEAITAVVSPDDVPRFMDLDDLKELEKATTTREKYADGVGELAEYEEEQQRKRLQAWRESCLK